jgi:hypothetical protein
LCERGHVVRKTRRIVGGRVAGLDFSGGSVIDADRVTSVADMYLCISGTDEDVLHVYCLA